MARAMTWASRRVWWPFGHLHLRRGNESRPDRWVTVEGIVGRGGVDGSSHVMGFQKKIRKSHSHNRRFYASCELGFTQLFDFSSGVVQTEKGVWKKGFVFGQFLLCLQTRTVCSTVCSHE